MTAWFGSKNSEDKQSKPNGDAPQESSVLTVTDAAREKVVELIQNAVAPVLGVRILAEATSPVNPEYSLAFVQEGESYDDDTVFEYEGFKVFVDADSMQYMDDVQLDFLSSGMSGGFQISRAPKSIDTTLEGPVADKLHKVIQEQINPALALHGGFVQLVDVKDSTAYIQLGGGCVGCGMVDVTLKQGIETMIKQSIPEITEILDQTDHASGQNPYYQQSK